MSGPWPVFAATDAFGCTSSSDSLTTVTGTPVALVKEATSARKASSSACTKRFQRITWSLAPFSGFQGALCAQACAHEFRSAPCRAARPPTAAPALSTSRRVTALRSVMVAPPWLIVKEIVGRLSDSLAARRVEKMHAVGLRPQANALAGSERVPLPEHRHDLMFAHAREQLRFRAGRLDHHYFGLEPVGGDLEVLGPDADDDLAALLEACLHREGKVDPGRKGNARPMGPGG